MSVENFIDGISIKKEDKIFLKSSLNILGKGSYDSRLLPKTFLFYGDPGVGKSFVASHISKLLECETVFYGITTPKDDIVNCTSFKEVRQSISNRKRQLIVLDDINLLLEKQDFEPTVESMRDFLLIFDIVRKSDNKILIGTINDMEELDHRTLDRIEAKIGFSPPSAEQKMKFMKDLYSDVISENYIESIAKSSVGYSFRDIPGLLTMSYALGEGKITENSLKRALEIYEPASFADFDVIRGIDTKVNDLIGLKRQKDMLKALVLKQKSGKEAMQKAFIESKVLFFCGPPGTGKTYSARAICGELKWPLITINVRKNLFYSIQGVLKAAKRHRECVVLIDEADKLFGGPVGIDDNDGEFVAAINSLLDGADKEPLQAIIILSVNNPYRFGSSLRNRCRVINFDLPNFEDRKDFFRKLQESVSSKIREDEASDFASKGEGMNYRELRRLWEDLTIFGKKYRKYEKYGDRGLTYFEDTGMMFG